MSNASHIVTPDLMPGLPVLEEKGGCRVKPGMTKERGFTA